MKISCLRIYINTHTYKMYSYIYSINKRKNYGSSQVIQVSFYPVRDEDVSSCFGN